MGQTGAVELTLPQLALTPNRLLLYVWLGRGDFFYNKITWKESPIYDTIDTNVDLPPLIIANETEDRKLNGVVSVEHSIRKIEMERPVAAMV